MYICVYIYIYIYIYMCIYIYVQYLYYIENKKLLAIFINYITYYYQNWYTKNIYSFPL